MLKARILAVLVTLFGFTQCKMLYQSRIPNGDSVPDPCNSGGTWPAVGHFNAQTGGATELTQFARDFAAQGHMWTQALCEMDSDQDGFPNGIELGDTNCNWTPGSTPAGPALGHPGICQPVGQGHCHSQHFTCV